VCRSVPTSSIAADSIVPIGSVHHAGGQSNAKLPSVLRRAVASPRFWNRPPGADAAAPACNGGAAARGWESEGGETAPYFDPVRILIVDEDMNTADSLELILHASGYPHTRVAYSGHEALAIAAEFQPELVLLEINLPDMNGYEVAQSLREQAGRDDLRLIALTSSRQHAGRELARVAGFERYLLTPVAPLDLLQLLQIPTQ
jgi:CheY-like chemotaxis protein